MEKLFWIGARESDICNEKIFFGSVTLFGTNKNNNYSYKNSRNEHTQEEYNNFIISTLYYLLDKYNSNCKFIFSNPKTAYLMPEDIQSFIICINEYVKVSALNDKFFQRQFLKDYCNMPPFIITNGYLIKNIPFVINIFNNLYNNFIVQKAIGGGGRTTFLLNSDNNNKINDVEQYLITPYFKENIPINVHCLIFENDNIIFPPSFQIINNEFNYIGADFIKAQQLSENIKSKIFLSSQKICDRLRKLKIRGLFGIDYLIVNDELYFLEINFRFQGSTFLLNYGLREKNMSIYELFINSFNKEYLLSKENFFDIKINYSFHKINDKNKYIPPVSLLKANYDGYSKEMKYLDKYYKYNIVYNKSIFDFFSRDK